MDFVWERDSDVEDDTETVEGTVAVMVGGLDTDVMDFEMDEEPESVNESLSF